MQPGRSTFTIPQDAPDHPTLVHALDAAADRIPDRVALIVDDRQLTFAQYRHAVGGMAAHLASRVGRGDTVAVVMGNSIEMAVADLGAQAAGGQVAPLNPNLTDRELTPLFGDIDPAVVLCSPEHAERMTALARQLGDAHVEIVGDGGVDVWLLADDAACRLPDDLPQPDDRCSMFFTGGTTGLPKGAEHTHRTTMAFCRVNLSVWRFGFDQEVILNVAPMFHIWGHHYSTVMPLYLGATAVVARQYQPDLVLDLLEQHRVTLFAGGPASIYVGLVNSSRIDAVDLSSSAVQPRRRRALSRGVAGAMGDSWPATRSSRAGACRKVRRSTPIRSFGPQKLAVDRTDRGRDRGRRRRPRDRHDGAAGRASAARSACAGPQFTVGYRNRPERNRPTIRDGWLYTGDIGYFDDDGYMFLVDRKKEMIIVGGYNVYPREIDELLTNHPAVREAATVGVPDAFLGEAVRSYVALRPGEQVAPEELSSYCHANLVKYKRPREIVILDELPKKGPGKIDKLLLKSMT